MTTSSPGFALIEQVWRRFQVKDANAPDPWLFEWAMMDALRLAIVGRFRFTRQDVWLLHKRMQCERWLERGERPSYFYALAIQSRSHSFCRSYENHYRPGSSRASFLTHWLKHHKSPITTLPTQVTKPAKTTATDANAASEGVRTQGQSTPFVCQECRGSGRASDGMPGSRHRRCTPCKGTGFVPQEPPTCESLEADATTAPEPDVELSMAQISTQAVNRLAKYGITTVSQVKAMTYEDMSEIFAARVTILRIYKRLGLSMPELPRRPYADTGETEVVEVTVVQ